VSGQRRLAEYDYATPGTYFVTICAHRMELRFGQIECSEMALNVAGRMVADIWRSLSDRHENIALDTYVVMPNHVHGIIHLGIDPEFNTMASLTTIIATFKSLTTTAYADLVRSGVLPPFDRTLWQRSFYDRIVRNQRELEAVREYILANPARWTARSAA